MAGPFYWVGGSGNSNDATNHWATSSGGAPGVGNVPNSTSDVHFDANSNTSNAAYTFTVAALFTCKDLMFDAKPGDGLGGTITWAGSYDMNVYGSLLLLSGMTRTWAAGLTFKATASGKTLTFNGKTLPSGFIFNGTGGVWTLQDNLAYTGSMSIWAGTVISNSKTMSIQTADFQGGTFDFSGSAISVAGNWNNTGTALTVDASSSIAFSGATFQGGGRTYNNVTMSVSGACSLTGANTFANLTRTGGANYTSTLSINGNQVVTGTFTGTGNSAVNRLSILSDTVGTARTITAATVSLTDVDFTDITGAGAASPFTGTRLGNAAGNSGITFTAAADKFYVGNTANWNGTVWALTSGGAAGANNFPLPQDTAKLDENSFSANGQTLTINGAFRLPSIVCSGTDQTYTIATSTNAPTLYGTAYTLDSNATISGTGLLTFSGRNTQTVTSAGKSWTQPISLYPLGVTLVLGDNFSGSDTVTCYIFDGTLDLNGNVFSIGLFDVGASARTRAVTDSVGGGKIITTGTSAATVFNASTTTNLTITRTNPWTIEIGGNTTNIRTVNLGAGKSWPTITFTNTTASGQMNLVSSSTATVIKSLAVSVPPQTIKRTAATTITIEDTPNGMPSGTAGNLVTIGSITAATHTWAGASAETPSYLSISRSTAPSNWDAGATSTDGGNNSGWLFGAVALAMAKVMHHLKMCRG